MRARGLHTPYVVSFLWDINQNGGFTLNKLSVMVITAREKAGFEDLVRSLQKSAPELKKHDCSLELVYVDRLWEAREELYKQAMAQIPDIDFVYVRDEPTAPGPCPSGARNAGVNASTGDWIVSIDDLTAFYEGSLLSHLNIARIGFDASISTFDVIQDDGEIIQGPKADSRLGDAERADGVWAANHFYGMHMAFTKDAWNRVGGFDLLFDGVYGQEDCDFGLRLWRAGCSVAWCEDTKVLCYRGKNHTSTHDRLFQDATEIPTAFVSGVPKWRNDALIQWNSVIGKVVANRGD